MFCSGLCPSVRARCPCCGMAPLSLRYKRTAGGHKQSEIYLFGAGERRQRPAVLLRAGDEGYSESVMFWNASKSGLERLTTIEILTTSTAMLEFENLTPAAEKKAEKLHLRLRMRHTGLLLSPVSLSLSLSLSLLSLSLFSLSLSLSLSPLLSLSLSLVSLPLSLTH